MWLSRLFKGKQSKKEDAPVEASIDQGVHYLYLIIGMQVLLVFGILCAILVLGQVLATPLWLFLAAFGLAVWGFVFIYRKAKRKLNELRNTIRDINLTDKNLEISIMGGMLTMRVEHNSKPLLEAPSNPVIDTETIPPPTAQ